MSLTEHVQLNLEVIFTKTLIIISDLVIIAIITPHGLRESIRSGMEMMIVLCPKTINDEINTLFEFCSLFHFM